MNVPPSWPRMGFIARAAYLCQTHQAKDFKQACEILKPAGYSRRSKPAAVYAPSTKPIRLPYAD